MNTFKRGRINYQHRFDTYLNQYRSRSRFKNVATTVGAVIFAVVAISLLAAVLGDTLAYSNWLYYPARLLLLATLIFLVVYLLWKPAKQLNHSDGAAQIESSVPAFQGRAETYIDMKRRNIKSPFVSLLAKDASKKAASAPVRSLLPTSEIIGPVAAATALLMLAAWMFSTMPSQWRDGMQHLWFGWYKADILPARSLIVEPGDTKIRQGDSLFVETSTEGFESDLARLHIKRDGSSEEWEIVDMNRQADGGFNFTLYGVSDPLEYYVSSAFIKSEQFNVEVVIPPKVENIELSYRYPEWTGRDPLIVESGGDIAAVSGTEVDLKIRTDKPLVHGQMIVNNQDRDLLSVESLHYTTTITVGDEDGEYQLAELLGDDQIMLTPEHTITVTEDALPTISFSRPGGDWNATAIEEVTVAATAADDFDVEEVNLHFSVNGGDWQSKTLRSENEYQHTFMLEEFSTEDGGPLLAGDLVTYYAEAKDRLQSVSTDIQFIDVRPFERRYTQSQQSSQGGGGGQQEPPPGEISQRQKEILVATWNLIKQQTALGDGAATGSAGDSQSGSSNGGHSQPAGMGRSRSLNRKLNRNMVHRFRPRQAAVNNDLIADSATLLSDLQNTLAEQAETLAKRAEARQLLNNDPKIAQFVDYMRRAAEAMRPSAEELETRSLQEAVQHQQRALKFLRRGELLFNDITINQNQGSGGGSGNNAGRDMAEIYELEMDLAKNQYETPDSGSGGGSQEESADDAFEKLKELARRQQELAKAAAEKKELSSAERWEQEKLRREIEKLKRELEQLQREQSGAENSQQNQAEQSQGAQGESQQGQEQQSEGQQGSQQSQSQGGGGGSQGEQSQTQQAIQGLEEALREMDRADQSQSDATQQERQQALQNASEKLQESLENIDSARQQRLQNQLTAASESVRDLSRQQDDTAQQLRDAMRRAMEARAENRFESGLEPDQQQQLAEQKREMQKQLEAVQQQMADAIKRFEEDAPETTQRLQQALDELESNKAAELMGISGDMIEDGMAPQASLREPRVTQALENLQNDLSEATALASDEADQAPEENITAADATRSLQQMRRALTEALRSGNDNSDRGGRELQQLDGSRADSTDANGSEGTQSGQDGQQQSQQGQSGGQATSGTASDSGTNMGTLNEATNDGVAELNEGQQQQITDARVQLERLTQGSIDGLSDSTVNEITDITRRLKESDTNENDRRIDAEVRLLLRQLEQLELQVYNESQGLSGIRTGKRSETPKGYDRRTADYFRRLSEGSAPGTGS